MRLLGLPGALARFGLTVECVPGWETRGSSSFNPGCTVGHHTAGSGRGFRPSLAICTHGRADLPGPLCNTFTDRNGIAVVVAAGRANHAGRGGFRGLVGNSSAIGHEAEDEGDGNWSDGQRWAFPRVHAAHLWLLGRDESWYCSHRTWTPRKPDPAGLPDDDMRRQIGALLRPGSAPPPPPPPPKEPVDMLLFHNTDPGHNSWFLVTGDRRSPWGLEPAAVDELRAKGVPAVPGGSQSLFMQLPTFDADTGLKAALDALRVDLAALAGQSATPEITAALARLAGRLAEARVEVVVPEGPPP